MWAWLDWHTKKVSQYLQNISNSSKHSEVPLFTPIPKRILPADSLLGFSCIVALFLTVVQSLKCQLLKLWKWENDKLGLYNVIQNSFQWDFLTFVAAIQHSNQHYSVNEACLVAPTHYIEKITWTQSSVRCTRPLGVSEWNCDSALAKIKLIN